jgi:hypothetical protein
MRAIDITAENAKALRELVRQPIETYSAFENLQKIIKSQSTQIAGPLSPGEVAALCKDSDCIEVVTQSEYLDDTDKIRWY